MTIMNITMTVRKVPAGKSNEFIKKCTLACFTFVLICVRHFGTFFLVRWTNLWQLDVLKN